MGEFHGMIPQAEKDNIEWRIAVLERALRDKDFRRGLMEMCRVDFLFWVNAFVWQYNPRCKGGEVGPFIVWPYEEEAAESIFKCIADDEPVRVIKSREMGATWLFLLIFAWMMLFKPWQKFLMISRSAEAVDRSGDSDSLFWRLDFVFDRLPSWMTAGRANRRKMVYTNDLLSSGITGQASTGKAGVSGRATAMLIDEFSQIDEAYDVWHQTADTTGARIFNFTFTGTDNCAYEISQIAGMREVRMLWYQHPMKRRGLYQYDADTKQVEVLDKKYAYPSDFEFILDGKLRSPWYDHTCLHRPARAIAMNLDCDPQGSAWQFFDSNTIRALKRKYATLPLWEGEVEYDRNSARPRQLMPRAGGPLKLWLSLLPDGTPPLDDYVISADTSAGVGATNSCLSIVRIKTGAKVGEFAYPRIDPKDFASTAVALCWLFKTPLGVGAKLIWELQGPGTVFGDKVKDLGYGHVYRKDGCDEAGWSPEREAKRLLLEDYRYALSSGMFLNPSETALEECLFFRYKGNKVEHSGETNSEDPTGASVNHGDRTIADALGWKIAKPYAMPSIIKAPEEKAPVGSLAWRRTLRKKVIRDWN